MQHFLVENLTVAFGGLLAVNNLSFSIDKGEILGLIGPNGAGKSTVFNAINHFVKASAGSIVFEGVDTLKLGDHKIISSGIARTFQNIELFRACTVLENLLIGHHSNNRTDILSGVLLSPKARREEKKARAKARELLELLGIAEHENALTEGLPFGEQKKVELARALMTEPRLILLDEPVAGMNRHETEELSGVILQVRDTLGMTILLVEHDMSIVMGICDRIVVMDYGKKIAEGKPEEIKRNPKVIEAYLGEMQNAEAEPD